MDTEKKIVSAGKKIVVKKQGFRKQIKFLNLIPKLKDDTVTKIMAIDTKNTQAALLDIVGIINSEIEVVVGYIIDLTDKQIDKKFLLDNCGIDDIFELIMAIIDVNKVKKVFDYKKKVEEVFTSQ
jgi:hypothetical protein